MFEKHVTKTTEFFSHCFSGCRVGTDVKPVYEDIMVKRDGTVKHSVQMYTTVVCGINLFNYPFVLDGCPIALNGWSDKCKSEAS